MPHLIDGYNLLYAANIVVEESGPYAFEKSRRALIRFLVAVMTPDEIALTTVVFDGREAPPGLPKEMMVDGVRVLFSEPGSEADDLIEQLLPSYSAPRRLTVVSSDHRIQRAARRRRARPVDSDAWAREMRSTRPPSRSDHTSDPRRTSEEGLSAEEVARWMKEFEDESS